MKFEGETLSIGGMELRGTVCVEAEVSDGSFSHEFGTERVMDLDFIPWGFVPDLKIDLGDKERLVLRAVQDWIDSHERQVMRAYEREVKS